MRFGNAGGGRLGRTRPRRHAPAAPKLKVQLREEAVEFVVVYTAELMCALDEAEELPPGSDQTLCLSQLTRADAARRSREPARSSSQRARRWRSDTCVGSQLS